LTACAPFTELSDFEAQPLHLLSIADGVR